MISTSTSVAHVDRQILCGLCLLLLRSQHMSTSESAATTFYSRDEYSSSRRCAALEEEAVEGSERISSPNEVATKWEGPRSNV